MMENFIRVYKNAYSPEYCNQVIDFFERARAAGFGGTRAEVERIPKHIKDDATIGLPYINIDLQFNQTSGLLDGFLTPFMQQFYNRYVADFSILENNQKQSVYAIRIQKTNPGGGYHIWHSDNHGRQYCTRLTVFSLYLNTVEEGGETEFLYQGIRIKPEQGTLIIWPSGFTHTHRGNPPLSGTKYIVTGWVEAE